MNLTAKQALILDIINNNPEVQNDDTSLIASVWRAQGWDDNKRLEDNISRVMHPETITRRRRELFNMGLIEYSDKAMKTRMEAMKAEQNNHSDYEKSFYGMFGVSSSEELLDSFPKLNHKPAESVSWLND